MKEGGKVNIVEKNLGELRPYENNPRKNEAAVPYVAESIKRYGFKNPIIIDKDGVIIASSGSVPQSVRLCSRRSSLQQTFSRSAIQRKMQRKQYILGC